MILLKDGTGRVLVAHKTGAPPGDWYFPSGGIEKGESCEETFWRELDEELGLGPSAVGAPERAPFKHQYRWGTTLLEKTGYEGQEQTILIATVGKDAQFDLARTGELDETRWVPVDELDTIVPHKDLLVTVRRVIEAGLL